MARLSRSERHAATLVASISQSRLADVLRGTYCSEVESIVVAVRELLEYGLDWPPLAIVFMKMTRSVLDLW